MKSLFESVIDEVREQYSPYVFEDPEHHNPQIKNEIREKILQDVQLIDEKVEVVDIFIKGSILTKQYTNDSDIDIYVQIKSDKPEKELRKELYDVWLAIDDKYMEGIPHPLQYFITSNVYNFENTEAAYDIINDKWIKHTPSKSIDLNEYMEDFQNYVSEFSDFSEELRRNIIDYSVLKDIPTDQVKGLRKKLDEKLDEINETIDGLAETYYDLRDFRNDSFSKDMTPSEIKKYGIKTRLPGNVVFKLIERYYYLDLYRRIREIIGDDDELTHENFDELNKILKTKLTRENVSFSNVFKQPSVKKVPNWKNRVKGRGDMQHKPRHRQQQDNAGMIGHGTRKSMNVVPDYQRNDPRKQERKLENSKKTGGRLIRVKQGSPQAQQLAQKYRIQNPVGKKTVAGNQNDPGITIIFEERKLEKQKLKKMELRLRISEIKNSILNFFKSIDIPWIEFIEHEKGLTIIFQKNIPEKKRIEIDEVIQKLKTFFLKSDIPWEEIAEHEGDLTILF